MDGRRRVNVLRGPEMRLFVVTGKLEAARRSRSASCPATLQGGFSSLARPVPNYRLGPRVAYTGPDSGCRGCTYGSLSAQSGRRVFAPKHRGCYVYLSIDIKKCGIICYFCL